jgi:hypothetical protein
VSIVHYSIAYYGLDRHGLPYVMVSDEWREVGGRRSGAMAREFIDCDSIEHAQQVARSQNCHLIHELKG